MSNPPFRYFKIQISYNEIPLDKTRSDVKQIVKGGFDISVYIF
jgi:hypothetical protein